jgi:glutathione synthase/RimK-type ligase-like ATP-grasp enzyme
MNFLIVTEPEDTHAILVTSALEAEGHEVISLFPADFPGRQKNSILVDLKEYHCITEDDFQLRHHQGYDVVWWRRPRQPVLCKEEVHPDDFKFHRRESLLFHENFTHQLAPGAWWVNRKEAAIRANYKLLQLKIASEVGMIIPTTLCSNHLDEILQFYQRFQTTGIIYKPISYQFWEQKEDFRVVYTSKIDDIEMIKQSSVQYFPGIYQECIAKKYELRVTCFGDYIVAAKLNSQDFSEAEQDWRLAKLGDFKIEPYLLPERLKQQIRFLMRDLGIVFGCLDFIVTPDDQYIFLEVNEQGQFLFLEEACDELFMLDIFVNFLVQQSMDFYWQPSKIKHRIEDYRDQMQKIYQTNLKKHLKTSPDKA